MSEENEQSTLGSLVSKVTHAFTPGEDSDGAPKETGDITNLYEMRDPVTMYPKPSFSKQPQSVPGLASDMHPKPDHGEKSYVGHGRLPGRKALVTGGDSGIGRAAAIAFAREGADVAINYLPEEGKGRAGNPRADQSGGPRGRGHPRRHQERAFCQNLVETAVRELGGLDIVVNNAGKQHATESITELTTEQFDATFKTNIYAMFWITKAAVPHLRQGASIINTTSVQAYDPSENLLDYAQTKAAQVAFTKALAGSWARRASASTRWPRDRSGRPCRSAAASRRRRSRPSAARRRWAAPASRWNSPRCTCCSPARRPATRPA